jgi:hypothetical protein
VSVDHTQNPDWQHAHRKMVELFEGVMLEERASGKARVHLDDAAIHRVAHWKAAKAVETAIRQYESPEAVAARKRKTGQAA